MRATVRLAARFLTPGAQTGLAGLYVHPAPRSTLVYLYSATLSKLSQFPTSSAYRVATENLTRHRLEIVEAVKPDGFDAWQDRIRAELKSDGRLYAEAGFVLETDSHGREFVHMKGEAPKLDDDVVPGEEAGNVRLELEPKLTTDQISEIEAKIGAGLIEEIVEMAEGELRLADTMLENKVWEDLEDKPVDGQWTYFDRTSS